MYNMTRDEFEEASRDPSERNRFLHMLHPRTGRC
jgi:hypothetical protein